jgi:hypothetical protein
VFYTVDTVKQKRNPVKLNNAGKKGLVEINISVLDTKLRINTLRHNGPFSVSVQPKAVTGKYRKGNTKGENQLCQEKPITIQEGYRDNGNKV